MKFSRFASSFMQASGHHNSFPHLCGSTAFDLELMQLKLQAAQKPMLTETDSKACKLGQSSMVDMRDKLQDATRPVLPRNYQNLLRLRQLVLRDLLMCHPAQSERASLHTNFKCPNNAHLMDADSLLKWRRLASFNKSCDLHGLSFSPTGD